MTPIIVISCKSYTGAMSHVLAKCLSEADSYKGNVYSFLTITYDDLCLLKK